MVDFLDASPRLGRVMKAVYEFQLRVAPWSYEAMYRMWFAGAVLCTPLAMLMGAVFGRRLQRWAAELGASAVVTTYPLSSVVLGRLRTRRRKPLDIPAITFVTDFAVHPLWVHRGIDLNLCVHPDSAAHAAELTGRPARAPGPLVADAFRADLPGRASARRELGLAPDARVALVVAGSWGVGELEETFDALAADGDWFPVAVCGRNEKLRQRLEAMGTGLVIGWTDAMATLMAASDVLVQNAGGLTCMEAFAVGLPVVTYRPIPGHGRQNALDMDRSGVAAFATDAQGLAAAMCRATDGNGQMAGLGRAMFAGDAAEDVREIARASAPLAAPAVHSAPRRVVVAGLAGVAMYAGLNLAADAASAAGVDQARPPAHSQAVYPFVRLGPGALVDPAIPTLLAADHFSAVVDGQLAATYPGALRQMARDGVTVANGGNVPAQDLHLLSLQDNVSRAATLIAADTRHRCRLYVPGPTVNDTDLIFAAASHERIVRAASIPMGGSLAELLPGHAYVLEGEKATGAQLATWLGAVHAHIASAGLEAAALPAVAAPARA